MQPIDELPIGGYIKDDHKYNRYNACIDTVDGIPTDEEKRAFLLINEYRASKSIEPLIWDQSAQVVAETRAIEGHKMHTDSSGQFAHTRPNGDDKDNMETGIVMEWANIGGLKGHDYNPFAWENAAGPADEYWENEWGYHTGTKPEDVINAWIGSPGHEAALVREVSADAKLYGAVATSHFDTDIRVDDWDNIINQYYWYYVSIEVYD